MRCRDACTALSARLDGELESHVDARLREHLDGCRDCRDEAARYQHVRARLRISEPIDVDLVPALRERLAGLGAPIPLDTERRRPPAWRRHRARALIAVAAVAVIVAVVAARSATSPTRVVPAAAPKRPELVPPTGASLLLAWTSGGLPDRALTDARRLPTVDTATEVRGADLGLTAARDARGRRRLGLPPGAVIPIDALAVDPRGYASNLPTDAARLVRALPRDGAILGATSARLRGVGVGGSLTFGATTVHVTGVLADSLVGAAEMVVPDDTALPVRTPRFVLITYRGDRSELEAAIRSAWHRPVRFRSPDETAYLRHGDAVLPQALVKARFGEFWYRVDTRGRVAIDPQWVARNIVTVDLPGLGRIACHRLVVAPLRRALTGLHVTTTSAVAYLPEFIDGDLGLSRHTWGIGISWQSATPPDAQVISRLDNSGFRWGGNWLNPSPDYFEWVGFPNA